jgi:hypothetical protein
MEIKQMNRREEVMKKLLAVVVGVVLVGFSQAKADTIGWAAAATTGLQLADGTTAVPVGDFIAVGYFASGGIDRTDAQIASDSFATLQANFKQFGPGAIGDGTGVPGTFTETSSNLDPLFNPPHRIYIWVVDNPVLASATQQAVISAPGNPNWVWAVQPDGVNSIDISDPLVAAIIGSAGAANDPNLTGNGIPNAFNLAVIVPEPSTVTLVGLGLLGLLPIRRRRS